MLNQDHAKLKFIKNVNVKCITMKALYIGSGCDIFPISFLSYIKDWVYIDCQPFSEFGKIVHICDKRWCPDKCIGYSRPGFIPKVIKNMKDIGLKYKKVSENELEFTNETQRVTFFVNTSVPEDNDRIKTRIKDFDNWIVMGHDPDASVLKYTTKNITFWGNRETSYSKCEQDDYRKNVNELCFHLNRIGTIKNHFTRFNCIHNGKVNSFDNWYSFVKHTNSY